MTLEFQINPTEPPWSTNNDRNLNKYTRAARIKAWKDSTAAGWLAAARNQKDSYPKVDSAWYAPSIVHLRIGFTTKRTRDPHNYCGTVLKAVVDGLVQAGVWPDDDPHWVGHRESELIIDPYTYVILTPKDQDDWLKVKPG